MATNSRKRPAGQKSAQKTNDEVVEPTSSDTESAASSETTDPSAKLAQAYWAALDSREAATGTIPAVELDAVRVAYLAVPKRNQQRGNQATSLNAEALQKMVTSGDVDPGMLQAMQALSSLFAEANESSGQAPTAPHDPVPGVAGLLAALDFARHSILAELTDDQRERLDNVDPTDPDSADASAGAVECLAKVGARVIHGRKRRKPTRSGKNLGEVIQNAVKQYPDRPVDFATISQEFDVNTSGLWSRWTANQTDGVQPVIDDRGRKAFQAAA